MMWQLLQRGVLLVLVSLWAVTSGQLQDCWGHRKCFELSSVPKLMECIETCKADQTLESPIYAGNSQLQPIEENIRNYVMGHFRWNKFGKKRANSTGLSGSKQESERVRALLVQLPAPESQAPEMESEDMGTQFPRQNDKRSYSMEHFRWGKPMGRKRRPIKVSPSNFENESVENMGPELKREESADFDYPAETSEVGDMDMEGAAKKDGKIYKMTHFRWGRGPKGSGQGWGPNHMYTQPLQFSNLEDMLQESMESGLPEEEVKKDGENYKFGHFRWSAPLKDKRYGGFMKSWDERGQKPLLTLFRNVIIKDGREAKAQNQ
ncbi:proopiomelanocortin a [Pristis pectinata]|uniref:proopiomelanocortin a n=1 Tax=Pristis pectinata TaxID=685728 RepID=UPI00223C8E8A|nr:proopiomelanocortin a [Pristis pectinata]XP_051868697.1 proopiomelanocortin a [Pristis pectinata]